LQVYVNEEYFTLKSKTLEEKGYLFCGTGVWNKLRVVYNY
jgi:hypothetical protein